MADNPAKNCEEKGRIGIRPELFLHLIEACHSFDTEESASSDDDKNFSTNNNLIHVSRMKYLKLLEHSVTVRDNDSFQELLSYNDSDVNSIDKNYYKLFLYTILRGTLTMVRALIDRGALLYTRDKLAMTPLHLAVTANRLEIVQYLLSSGVPINAVSRSGSYTPLHFAVVRKNLEMIDLLVSSGADVNATTSYDSSALLVACGNFLFDEESSIIFQNGVEYNSWIGDKRVIEYLLDHGADINKSNQSGETALHSACTRGTSDIIELLLQRGANLDARDDNGLSALHFAMEGGDPHIIKLLLQRGMDVNVKDHYENPPLFHLIWSEKLQQTLDLLVEHGVSINIPNVFGETALHRVHDSRVAQHLLKLGADINILDEEGFTPFTICLLYLPKDKDSMKCLELMTTYITKKIANNEQICGENLESLKIKRVEPTFKKCNSELERMKDKICNSSRITFFDILGSDCHRLVGFLRNTELREAIRSSGYEDQFPMFGSFLRDSIDEANKRRDLIDVGSVLLKRGLKLNLPWIIMNEIFGHLKEKDLETFVIAFSGRNRKLHYD